MSVERNELKQTGSKVVKFSGSMDRINAQRNELAQSSGLQAAEHALSPAEVKCENGVCSVSWKPKRPAA